MRNWVVAKGGPTMSLSSFRFLTAVVATSLLVSPQSVGVSLADQFDGTWRISHRSATCTHKQGGYTLTIANGKVRGRVSSGTISGSISASGDVRWSHPAAIDGAPVDWEGRFRSNKGLGTYVSAGGKCGGTFTARRN
jgi:hypothetical protein